MSRSNNTILFIVLLVLLGGFVLSRLFRTPSLERNLAEHLLTLDTSKINAIHITPASEKVEIKLVRTGKTWLVQRETEKANAETSQLKSALQSIHEIHPERIVTRKKEKWATYNVDTTGTHVKVYADKGTPTEFWVGKTSAGGTTVRLNGENEVYEVKESLDQYFNKRYNGWRDKSFLKLQPEKISEIVFQYPGDSSFVVSQSNGKWRIGSAQADSTKVLTYLNRFRSRTLAEFADDFAPQASPKYSVTLNGDTGTVLSVQGWKVNGQKWVAASSVQDSVYFSADESLMNDLFTGKKSFLQE